MFKPLRIFLLIILSLLFVTFFYQVTIKKPATQIFCQKKVNAMILNFKLSVNFTSQSEEEKYVNGLMKELYEQCLRQEL